MPVPSWLRAEVGSNKTFEDIRNIIEKIRQYMQSLRDTYRPVAFPDIEILPTFRSSVMTIPGHDIHHHIHDDDDEHDDDEDDDNGGDSDKNDVVVTTAASSKERKDHYLKEEEEEAEISFHHNHNHNASQNGSLMIVGQKRKSMFEQEGQSKRRLLN